MVSKQKMSLMLVIVLMASFALGYFLADFMKDVHISKEQKPVINIKNEVVLIEAHTPIVFEKEYIKSNQVVISDFQNKADIIGKTLDQIRSQYTVQNGFSITYTNGSLLIRQKIDDWSPDDKAKLRLKIFKGMIAVYQGPNGDNDTLLRVTAIHLGTLPPSVQELVKQGKYEFKSEEALNDALENLDEYV